MLVRRPIQRGPPLNALLGSSNCSEARTAPTALPLPECLDALPAHLAATERRFSDIVPGTEKEIGFGPSGPQRAPWAVVYLHGFSASRQEMAPLPQQVAQCLRGHCFSTRLTGHGRGGAAMVEASVDAWKTDALEALAIGRMLGERVLIIGASTGATLAVWLAQQPQARDRVAWVLLSPNFGPRDRRAEMINWPLGRVLARWLIGPAYGFEPRSADHARYWTTRFRTEALFPMMTLVHTARRQSLEQWHSPVLMMLSPRDQVIDITAARAAFARIGSGCKRLLEVHDCTDALQHVIAGRILSPGTTAAVARRIVDWVLTVPLQPTG